MTQQKLSDTDIKKYQELGRECQIFGFKARDVSPEEVFCFIGFLDKALTDLLIETIELRKKLIMPKRKK